jgi:hypothetical protein
MIEILGDELVYRNEVLDGIQTKLNHVPSNDGLCKEEGRHANCY